MLYYSQGRTAKGAEPLLLRASWKSTLKGLWAQKRFIPRPLPTHQQNLAMVIIRRTNTVVRAESRSSFKKNARLEIHERTLGAKNHPEGRDCHPISAKSGPVIIEDQGRYFIYRAKAEAVFKGALWEINQGKHQRLALPDSYKVRKTTAACRSSTSRLKTGHRRPFFFASQQRPSARSIAAHDRGGTQLHWGNEPSSRSVAQPRHGRFLKA